jgi:hypothetical protein
MRRTALLIGLIACIGLPALAGELSGVTFPDQLAFEGKTLVLNGLGLRKAYGIAKVYVAGLYLEKKSASADEILATDALRRIELRFVRNVGRDDIVKAWTEGFEKNAGGSLPSLKDRLESLNRAMPELREGDLLAFSSIPERGTVVEVNGKASATIPGADFAKVLFSIWLGPNPPNTALREGLLGHR